MLSFKAEELKKLKDIEEEQGTTQEVSEFHTFNSSTVKDINIPMLSNFRVIHQGPNMKSRQKTESCHVCLKRDLKKWKISVV